MKTKALHLWQVGWSTPWLAETEEDTMENLEEVLVESALLLLRNLDELPKYDGRNQEQVKKFIDDGAQKIKAKLYDEAIHCFEEAIRLSPRSFGAHLAMIKGFREKGKDLEALSWGGFALALADTREKRKLAFLLMGSAALDTFKLSRAIDHANQSLVFYRLALEEDPTELRAVWNSIETHIEVILSDQLDDVTRLRHRRNIENKLVYLNETFSRSGDVSLPSRFVVEGEKIERRLREKAVTVPEFNEGLFKLRSHVQSGDDIQMANHYVGEADNSQGLRTKIRAYVLMLAILSALPSSSGDAHASANATIPGTPALIEEVAKEPIYGNPKVDRVFVPRSGSQLEVAVVDPDWDEIKELAVVDPDWEEMKKFA